MFALSLFLLLGYTGFLYWYITRRYLPRFLVVMTPVVEGEMRHRLARSSYKVLHFIHAVLLFLAILWLPVAVGILLHYKGDFGSPPGLSIYANMLVDLGQIENLDVTGLTDQVIRTKTEIDIDSPNYINAFIFSVTRLVKLMLLLFVVLQLRNILASLCNGDSFSSGNSQRLNWIGKIIVFAYLAGPVWHFFLSASVINTVEFSSTAITMTPSTDGSLLGLVVGVGVLIASAVIKEAEQLMDEQRYTI